MTFNERRQKLKADKGLAALCLIFLLLAIFHIAYSFFTEHTQCYVRCGFCLLIVLSTVIFLRPGFAITLLAYAYTLVYFNTFFNYTSYICVLIACRCMPKIKIPALILYAIDIFILFAVKQIHILALGTHILNCLVFYIAITIFFIAKNPAAVEKLTLTEDETTVLRELASGKLQKQIEQFSVNTVTKLLKTAMERNNCRTKNELLNKFIKENPSVTESQISVNESQS